MGQRRPYRPSGKRPAGGGGFRGSSGRGAPPRAVRRAGPDRVPEDRRSRLAAEVARVAKPAVAKEAGTLLDRAVDKLALGETRGALEAALRARALVPRSAGVREVLGMALYQLGDYREALRELQTYKRFSGRSDQNHLIGDAFRALGTPEKAVPLAEEALRAQGVADEAKAEAAVVGGSALADLGRFTEALTLLRRWRIQESKGVRAWDLRVMYVTADVLVRAGRDQDAREEFQKILRHDADAYDVRERLDALGGTPPPSPRPAKSASARPGPKGAGKGKPAPRKPSAGRKPAGARKPAARKPSVTRKGAPKRAATRKPAGKRPPRAS